MVDADPESAGLVRRERPGWAILLAGIGAVATLGSFFVGWFRTSSFLSPKYLEQQGQDSGEVVAETTREWPTPFSAVDAVREASGSGRDPYDPGVIAQVVFPWLALALTVACCLVVVLAAVGLRRRTLTGLARIGAVAVLVATLAVVALGTWDLGLTKGGMDYGPEGPESPAPAWTSWHVHLDAGIAVWSVGMVLLAIAAVMGPRITHVLPAGMPSIGPAGMPGGPAGMPGFAPAGIAQVRSRSKVAAIVAAAVGVVGCVVGYGFLPWGEETTFSDIGEAAREYGFKDNPLAEAYFAWLGWAIVVVTIAVLITLGLARGVDAISAAVVRPILIVLTLAAGAVHAWVWIDLASDGAEFLVGAYAVAAGLFLVFVGASAPLHSSARVMVQQAAHPPPPAGPRGPSGA